MLGTEKPSLNNKKTSTNKTRSLSLSNTNTVAATTATAAATLEVASTNLKNKSKTTGFNQQFNSSSSNSSKHSSIHQFNYKQNHIKSKTTVVLMPKVYQLNFDENFVEKELINRNDGAHSRRGILPFFFI